MMLLFNVNLVAVFLAAVAYMAVGMLWYSPLLFGNSWMKLMGYTAKDFTKKKQKANVNMAYAMSFVGGLVSAFVLGHLIYMTALSSLANGLAMGFLVWLGFTAPVQLTAALFGGKPLELFFLDTGYQLVALMTMGAVMVYLV